MINFSSDPYIAENQMRAIIYYMVAFAYIDQDFDPKEKQFIRRHVGRLVEQRAKSAGMEAELHREVVANLTRHFHEVLDEIDHTIQSYFSESVALGETTEQFVLAKLKLGCFELLKRFDEQGQQALLGVIEELMLADGVVHPNEVAFRDDVVRLVHTAVELDEAEIEVVEAGEVIVDEVRRLAAPLANHPFFPQHEWDFAKDPQLFQEQSRGDMELVGRVMETLARQRASGSGRLAGARDFSTFPPGEQFLDGHVYLLSPLPEKDYELLVLGDLHGCYSCLKAALLQADFFGKVHAHHDNPRANPDMRLVLLGDYIDRGRFSLSGTLRTAMLLFCRMPDQVYMLRGNHEYYVELDGKVLAPVRPCEAMESIARVARNEVFVTYMNLFEALPNMLVFGQTLFVHGGLPRAGTLQEKWTGLETLNDPEIRFQMMWSDPSEADAIPPALQQANARFPFGRKQFHQFMARLGCRTLVRGHERVDAGFCKAYDDPEGILLTLFSAGGERNLDLPEDSNYRDVRPMALTMRYRDGIATITPFEIEYERYNEPRYNAFFQEQVGGVVPGAALCSSSDK